jgi:hypothetical protein
VAGHVFLLACRPTIHALPAVATNKEGLVFNATMMTGKHLTNYYYTFYLDKSNF